MKERQIRIRMLGNHLEYEVGKEYDVDAKTANQLSGIGAAVILVDQLEAAPAGEED